MKITGWRALLAGGALMFGTTALAGGGTEKTQQQGSVDEQSQQEGMGGSGTEGAQPQEEGSSDTWENEGTLGEGTGGSGDVYQDDRPFEEGGIEMERESVEGTGGSGQQGSLSGKVVESKKDMVFLELEQGAIVPVKVSEQTTAQKDGKEVKGQKTLKGVKAGDQLTIQVEQKDNQNHASSIEFSEGSQEPRELEGRIASVQGDWINLEHEGALIPLKADKKTEFQSQGDKQVRSAKELKQGDEIRASFEAKGNINNAKSIEVTSAMGGSSDQGMEQQPTEPEPMPEEPIEEPGTGGASEEGVEPLPEEPIEEPGTGGASEEGMEPLPEEGSYEEPGTGGASEEGIEEPMPLPHEDPLQPQPEQME